mmetsp:Transcript_21307/g.24765  ORF Transcript_21307/g.24765 Transcript_21307/m.24765 type:complete len:147 (-) Transcript_21307:42-482(-)
MSYSVRKLRNFIEDDKGVFRSNAALTKRYAMAYDDHESRELMELLSPEAHISSFWGTVRGPDAGLLIMIQERESMRITWTEPFVPITSQLFERRGYAEFSEDGGSVPVLSSVLRKAKQQQIRESIVWSEGRITFRDLGLQWRMAVV